MYTTRRNARRMVVIMAALAALTFMAGVNPAEAHRGRKGGTTIIFGLPGIFVGVHEPGYRHRPYRYHKRPRYEVHNHYYGRGRKHRGSHYHKRPRREVHNHYYGRGHKHHGDQGHGRKHRRHERGHRCSW